jgi:long-subunit fatty acid transport protein
MFGDGLRDTWGFAIGLRHQIDPRWSASGGLGYDSSPVKKGRAPVYFPVSDQWGNFSGLPVPVTRW